MRFESAALFYIGVRTKRELCVKIAVSSSSACGIIMLRWRFVQHIVAVQQTAQPPARRLPNHQASDAIKR